VHATVWEQMQEWLDNLALAFPNEAMTLPEWLPILEAGLEGLTVGVIPPVLDQVLVGAIDRSRNPDLKRVLILGMNETVFPAAPRTPVLLTERDRERLEDAGQAMGPLSRHQLGHERFYGYIACTRARDQAVCTYARQDANGQVLNPSGFIRHLQRLFPWVTPESGTNSPPRDAVEHGTELVGPILKHFSDPAEPPDPTLDRVGALPVFQPILERLHHLREANRKVHLDAGLASALYGPVLRTSVSRIERFAHCPFRHFVESGLRVEERKKFELDVRQQGSFQHEVLMTFHEALEKEGLTWRALGTPEEASRRVGQIADALIPEFEHGLMKARGQHRFLAEYFKASLQRFIQVVMRWMNQYEFDPTKVELGFGGKDDPLPAWELELDGGRRLALRGRIDRVDTWRDPATGQTWCVVIDYKSGERKPDRLFMDHGLEQQLPAYLNVLCHAPLPEGLFKASSLHPAGVFYVGLRGNLGRGESRADVIGSAEETLKRAYQHKGLFDLALRPHLDSRPGASSGDQFSYRINKDGTPHGGTFGCLETSAFEDTLRHQETLLRRFGNRIYQGDVAIDPWKKGGKAACDQCDFQAICRIDPWTHEYRTLRPLHAKTAKKKVAHKKAAKKANASEGEPS